MSVLDLVFSSTVDSETIYDPKVVTSGITVQVTVTNMGEEDLSSLGLYVVPTTSLLAPDNPAQHPPETDYQDLLDWGTSTDMGLVGQGGLKVTVPQNSGTAIEYITRTQGNLFRTKIPFKDLAAGASETFSILLETPPAVSARRLFVNIVLE